ncbi:hypothetical protein GcM3_030029 [Golovinomyces cichoracearum]|uniref:Uncharacterized protein n=1 Tax=Golovinomyces cichoracearum TaxID=62708 RepID=A0A420J545_9PEZI|nr:hypothetical protein GcM3_030029 [Golovinomyces cichoracearum]
MYDFVEWVQGALRESHHPTLDVPEKQGDRCLSKLRLLALQIFGIWHIRRITTIRADVLQDHEALVPELNDLAAAGISTNLNHLVPETPIRQHSTNP